MGLKRIARKLIILNLVAVALTATIAVLRGRTSLSELFDLATYVAIGMGAFGGLMFLGSAAGSGPSTGISASAADQPNTFTRALWSDRTAGTSGGVLLPSAAVMWFGIAWGIAKLLDVL